VENGIEVREFGDNIHLVVYTESQEVRSRLKKLQAFDWENVYKAGKTTIGVDVYLDKGKLPEAQRKELQKEARKRKRAKILA